MTESQTVPVGVDVAVPHSARVYDYWLGGKTNYAADRALAEVFMTHIPSMRAMAAANRDFVGRVSRYLTAQGIDQVLDIGTGIPTSPNLHETAREVLPGTRVVYVDNDPVVLAHARALMDGTDPDTTAFVDGDVLDPDTLLARPEVRRVLDLDRPVALTVIATLMLVDDAADPTGVMARFRDALAPGSLLAVTHPTADFAPDVVGTVTQAARASGMTFVPRSREQVAAFLGDWDVVEPGVVPVLAWRPDEEPADPDAAFYWAGAARKPA